MKMAKSTGVISLMFLILVFLVSCIGGKFINIEGYILSIDKDRILIAEDISLEKYKEIADKSVQELDIPSKDRVRLLYLSYEDIDGLNKGDKVKAKIYNDFDDSYPVQGRAEEITVIN